MRYDVVILGGGPAGAATALMLRQHAPSLSVALVERSGYEQVRIGETLPPHAQPLLGQLGVWDAFTTEEHVKAHGTSAAWGSDVLHENEFIYSAYGQGWHLDRRRFDMGLARKAEARGVRVFAHSHIVEEQPADDGWQLVIETGEEQRHPLAAAFVVDATGRRAVFARRQGARKISFDHLIGVFVFFDLDGSEPLEDSRTLVEAWPGGWWYSAILPGDQLVVVCMTDANLAKTHRLKEADPWLACLAQTQHTKRRIGWARPCGQPTVHAAQSSRLDRFTGSRWLAVGDAASTFDPLSGQGIFKALRFGVLAAYAVSDCLEGEEAGLKRYAALVASSYEAYLETRMDYYRKEQRWPDAPFWQGRFGRITLDPLKPLSLGPSAPPSTASRKSTMHLSGAGYERLRKLCEEPRAAHEVVAAFRAQGTQRLSDRRIILAVQQLLEEGVLAG